MPGLILWMQQEEVLIYSFFQFSSLNIVHFNGTFAKKDLDTKIRDSISHHITN